MSVQTETIVNALILLRDKHAHRALTVPKGKTGFDYGFASGQYHGFCEAVKEIERLLDQDAEDDQLKERD
jgi:hypothetical protein